MKNVYTWAAKPATRSVTIADFRADAMGGAFPSDAETAGIDAGEFEGFLRSLDDAH